MPPLRPIFRPLALRPAVRHAQVAMPIRKQFSTSTETPKEPGMPEELASTTAGHGETPDSELPIPPSMLRPRRKRVAVPEPPKKHIKVYPAPKAIKKVCANPVDVVTQHQIKNLDPTGLRTRLFAQDNPDSAGVGDILLVRQKNGDPFAGVCINIRRRGVDTGILLRGQLTRVSVEAWFKIYSPNVEGIEIVKKIDKKPRRAKLYYMRKPKHDLGSVENILKHYQTRRRALGATAATKDTSSAFKVKKEKKETKVTKV